MNLEQSEMPDLESAFQSIYGDNYKEELYGLSYKSIPKSEIYKPVQIPSLDSMFKQESLESHSPDYSKMIVDTSVSKLDVVEVTDVLDVLETNQAVFKILKTHIPDIYNLYWNESNELTKQGVAFVSTMKMSKLLQTLFANNVDTLNINVICDYNAKHQKWMVIKQTVLKPSNKDYVLKIMDELDKRVQLDSL
jgi:hypothetical protein